MVLLQYIKSIWWLLGNDKSMDLIMRWHLQLCPRWLLFALLWSLLPWKGGQSNKWMWKMQFCMETSKEYIWLLHLACSLTPTMRFVVKTVSLWIEASTTCLIWEISFYPSWFNFIKSQFDSSLILRMNATRIVVFLVYVNDFVIKECDYQLIEQLIYGLKQAPRAWFEKFRSTFLDLILLRVNLTPLSFSEWMLLGLLYFLYIWMILLLKSVIISWLSN